MGNRRDEERERLRQAREERETKQERSGKLRMFAVYGVVGAIGIAVLAGVVSVIASSGGGGSAHINVQSGETHGFAPDERAGTEVPAVQVADLQKAVDKAGCVVRLELEDEGKSHLPPDSEAPNYKTNPPTSGDHDPSPQADGAFGEKPDDIYILHTLEHGRMEIQYDPDLPEEDQLQLKGLYETMYGGTLFFPNPDMEYAVAATTWTNLLGCPEYEGAATLDAIRAFGKETWGRYGGEGVGAVQGPTPVEPALN